MRGQGTECSDGSNDRTRGRLVAVNAVNARRAVLQAVLGVTDRVAAALDAGLARAVVDAVARRVGLAAQGDRRGADVAAALVGRRNVVLDDVEGRADPGEERGDQQDVRAGLDDAAVALEDPGGPA